MPDETLMSTGIGFNGTRLREAREVRAITQTDLAARVDVTSQAISRFESGRTKPGPDTLERIAHALRMPVSFFLQAGSTNISGAVFYRSMSAATKRSRSSAEQRLAWAIFSVDRLQEFISFPAVRVPRIPTTEPLSLSDEDIEESAEFTRRSLGIGLGPISNITWLIENGGGVLLDQPIGDQKLEGHSTWTRTPERSRPFIVTNASVRKSTPRRRFTIAHELAHVVLHHSVAPEVLLDSTRFRAIEQQANKWAAAFMLPAATFAQDLIDLGSITPNDLLNLKPRWKVAVSAMIMRAADLEFIDENRKTRLFQDISSRGWRRGEPLDDFVDAHAGTPSHESPRLLSRAIKLLLDNNVLSIDDLLQHFGCLPANEVEATLGLPPCTLSGDRDAPALRLRF